MLETLAFYNGRKLKDFTAQESPRDWKIIFIRNLENLK